MFDNTKIAIIAMMFSGFASISGCAENDFETTTLHHQTDAKRYSLAIKRTQNSADTKYFFEVCRYKKEWTDKNTPKIDTCINAFKNNLHKDVFIDSPQTIASLFGSLSNHHNKQIHAGSSASSKDHLQKLLSAKALLEKRVQIQSHILSSLEKLIHKAGSGLDISTSDIKTHKTTVESGILQANSMKTTTLGQEYFRADDDHDLLRESLQKLKNRGYTGTHERNTFVEQQSYYLHLIKDIDDYRVELGKTDALIHQARSTKSTNDLHQKDSQNHSQVKIDVNTKITYETELRIPRLLADLAAHLKQNGIDTQQYCYPTRVNRVTSVSCKP